MNQDRSGHTQNRNAASASLVSAETMERNSARVWRKVGITTFLFFVVILSAMILGLPPQRHRHLASSTQAPQSHHSRRVSGLLFRRVTSAADTREKTDQRRARNSRNGLSTGSTARLLRGPKDKSLE